MKLLLAVFLISAPLWAAKQRGCAYENLTDSYTQVAAWDTLSPGRKSEFTRYLKPWLTRHLPEDTYVVVAMDQDFRKGEDNRRWKEYRLFVPRGDGKFDVHRALVADDKVQESSKYIASERPVSHKEAMALKLLERQQEAMKAFSEQIHKENLEAFEVTAADLRNAGAIIEAEKIDRKHAIAYAIATSAKAPQALAEGMKYFDISKQEAIQILSGKARFDKTMDLDDPAQARFLILIECCRELSTTPVHSRVIQGLFP